ncbi:MAG TPA: M90 family metallopeptidase [Pirellulaceae bacterium]|nr:M90 family metallopeptidase [Pirellulaceae bacterium]
MLSWFFKGSRRRKLMAEPVPDDWRGFVERNVGIYTLLPEAKQQRLLGASRVIAAERHWVGCRGLEMTDEIKATVAAQAAILLLGVEGYYFDKLPAILVYPGAFARPHSPDNLTVDEEAGALGESWQGGNIVLSWKSALAGGRDPHDGQNVVLHEFAHHLDSLDGEAGGHPPQPTHAASEKWNRVTGAEYERLVHALQEGQPTLLDPYGAENEAEFFAVATETFFERPTELLAGHGEMRS